ncbi:protein phosphatase 2C domain-containing protein [Streptomyces sp. NPDC001401]|uniref:protein phosphatase 2C domain-containing protein n=1 Tax=Streptomyces sp. NPDC001401 TaxID=3364570 RepID=UPI00367732AD
MEKWSPFRRSKAKGDERPPTPEPPAPETFPAPTDPPPPSGPRQGGTRPASAPPGTGVPEFAVPEFEVPGFDVPAYDGPDLTGPATPGTWPESSWAGTEHRAPDGTAQRPGPPRGEGAGQAYDTGRQGTRDSYGGAPGQAGGTGPSSAPRHAIGSEPAGVPPQRASAPRHAAPGPQPGSAQPGSGPSEPDSRRVTSRWRRIVLGRAAAQVEPKPPPADPYRPDTIFDGWSTPHLTVRLASVRGDQHRFDGRPRQDDVVVAWHEPTATVVFAVADGVSSAAQSHVGAALVCRTAVNDLLAQLGQDRSGPDWTRVLQAARYQLLMRVARGREPDEHDKAEAIRTLATTLVAGTVAPTRDGSMDVTLVRAGDSTAWCLQQGQFNPLLSDGDSGPEEISSTAVVALPRLSARAREMNYTLPPDGVLLVGTDGFGVPLGDGTGMVGDLFGSELAVPPAEPRTLAHLLDFSRETFDDDRTLLAVWPRHRLSGGTR